MKRILLSLSVLLSVQVLAQQKSVLFLGNSYVYTANLPGTLYNLALAGGDTIYHESNTPGGYTLEGHSTNATSLAKIASRDWDFVVLQEQSQKPAFPPSQVASETFPFAEVLVDSIKSNYACTEPVFFMTWGRKDGDQSNCQFYPPLCSFEGMNARLRESYLEMGANNSATVAPCGAAWQQMKLQNNTFWNGLYSGDGSHPSAWGTYLNACVFYATIFRQSPVGIPYYSSIGQQDAEDLQQLAEDMVLDSLSSWFIGHQDVVANATNASQLELTVEFSSNSENETDHFWDFGDGTTSMLENPQHTYSQSGTFDVTYIASSSCGADTATFQVSLSPSSVTDSDELNTVTISQMGKQLVLNNPTDYNLNVTVLDYSGRIIGEDVLPKLGSTNVEFREAAGIYMIRISNGVHFSTRKVVLQ